MVLKAVRAGFRRGTTREPGIVTGLVLMVLFVTSCQSPTEPLFERSGTGASVFDIPSSVSRIQIAGTYNGSCENFIVLIGNELFVNEILGTCSVASGRNYDGTHATRGGRVEVKSSTGITWRFTEVR